MEPLREINRMISGGSLLILNLFTKQNSLVKIVAVEPGGTVLINENIMYSIILI
jgi:hypothetical protein